MAKTYRDPGPIEFEAVIRGSGGTAGIEFPYDLKETYGVGNLVPVRVLFDETPYRGSIAVMGGRTLIGLTKAVREQLGKSHGETVRVRVELDAGERTVEVPTDFAEAMSPEIRARFDALAFTHRKEYVRWIEEAKRPETRTKRIAEAIQMLEQGKTRS